MGNCIPSLFSKDPERAKRRLQSTQLYSHQQNDMIAEFDNGIMKQALSELDELTKDRIALLEYAKNLSRSSVSDENEDAEEEPDAHVAAQLEQVFLRAKLLEPQIKHAKNHVIQLQGRRQLVIERKRMAAREGAFGAMLEMAPDNTKASQKAARQNADKAAKVRDNLEEEEDLTGEYAIETVDTPQADLIADAAHKQATEMMRNMRERSKRGKAKQVVIAKKGVEGEGQPGVSPALLISMPSAPTRPLGSGLSVVNSSKKAALALRTD